MTPYELRFEIFKQAYGQAQDEFQANYNLAEMWNDKNTVKVDYPQFPTYEQIETLADKINNFVSSK
ncbi:MAG: hypothetical protein EBU90_31140 [Proteobacteria bacterium]|nr:hypothetical protein [Pseudomonadota bacterium]